MPWLFPILRFGIGYSLPPGQGLSENWKWRTVWGLASFGLTTTPALTFLEGSVSWMARGLWAGSNFVRVGAPLASGGRALLATGGASAGGMGAGTLAASIMAGYALGAVGGTGIAYAFWGEKGARDAIDFYTRPKDIPRKYKEVVFPALSKTFMNYEWDLGPKPILSGPIV